MVALTTKKRKMLPTAAFAGPKRSYPVEDRSHAADAKSRASQAVNTGRMSPGVEKSIDAKANKVLGAGHQSGRHGGVLKPSPAGRMGHSKPVMEGVKSDRGEFKIK